MHAGKIEGKSFHLSMHFKCRWWRVPNTHIHTHTHEHKRTHTHTRKQKHIGSQAMSKLKEFNPEVFLSRRCLNPEVSKLKKFNSKSSI